MSSHCKAGAPSWALGRSHMPLGIQPRSDVPLSVWCTTTPPVTALVNVMLAATFDDAITALPVADDRPFLYADSVVLFFSGTLPAGLRDFCTIFAEGGARVHNVIAVGGQGCRSSQFYSSAGEQTLGEHASVFELLRGELEVLLAGGGSRVAALAEGVTSKAVIS